MALDYRKLPASHHMGRRALPARPVTALVRVVGLCPFCLKRQLDICFVEGLRIEPNTLLIETMCRSRLCRAIVTFDLGEALDAVHEDHRPGLERQPPRAAR